MAHIIIFLTLGRDYIPFLDLEARDGIKLEVVTPDEHGTNTSDYYSRPVFVDIGIPIGARDELTSVLYVSDSFIFKSCGRTMHEPYNGPPDSYNENEVDTSDSHEAGF